MGMRNHNQKAANRAGCLPSFFAGNNAVPNAGGERIVEYFARRLEGYPVLGLVPPALFLIPFKS
jgi:hypothetical protein